MLNETTTSQKAALRVAALYAIFSLLWIGFSDQILFYFVKNPELLTRFQMFKGWAFVIVTAAMVYALLLRELLLVKRFQKDLANREKRLNILFDHAADAIFVVGFDGQLIQFNQQACLSTGYSADEMARLNIVDIDDVTKTVDEFQEFVHDMEPGVPVRFESCHRRKDGTTFPVEVTGALLEMPDGHQIIGIARDITQRKKLMAEYGRTTQLAALGTVAAGVAHEINNPMNGVINFAQLIYNAPEKIEQTREFAGRIIHESQRITALTKNLLHYSRKSGYEMLLSDVQALVEGVLSLIKINIEQQGVNITTDFAADLPRIAVNPQGLQQIVTNLMSNAFAALQGKQMPSAEKNIGIKGHIVSRSGTQFFALEVHDNGPGMSAGVMAKAKDAFFSTKPSSEGTGLGLSIVSEIVDRHNGKLEIESREGEYSKFVILLPLTLAAS